MDARTMVFALLGPLLAGGIAAAEPAPWIEWDASTRLLVQKGAGYARIARLANRELLIAFSQGADLCVRHSRNEGKTWEPSVTVAKIEGSLCTNAELLILTDGTVLALFNERPREALPKGNQPPRDGLTRPFRILASQSQDHGKTWGAHSVLYSAGNDFSCGCWEPAAVQLPGGEVQVYFANEGPYRKTNEQEITMLRSKDSGKTWDKPETVSFRPKHRDGMPVPLVLMDGRGIVLAIEDNGLAGPFKPAIIHTSLKENWSSGVVNADSPHRWGALAPPLPPSTYAGAPYIRQLPSGEVLLSYQESAKGNLETSRMAVCMGDREAKNFSSVTYPFPGEAVPQLWNSLFVKDARTVTAVTDAPIGGVHGIWIVDGRLTAKP